MAEHAEIWFDRTISDVLLEMLSGQVGRRLIARIESKDRLYDVQLRSARPKSPRSWATLYYGLTSILDIVESKGSFRLKAHATYTKTRAFDPSWSNAMTAGELANVWGQVEIYLDEVQAYVKPAFTEQEGRVHAAIASGESDAFRVINREASPSFSDQLTKNRITQQLWAPIAEALVSSTVDEPWWPSEMKVGQSLDFLAVDVGGRLALIEAKHHTATGMIAKVAAQVGSYARLYSYLLQSDRREGLKRFDSMLQQRVQLGLSHRGVLYLTEPIRLVPVVAIGPGIPSAEARRRLWLMAQALDRIEAPRHPAYTGNDVTIDPLEVWYLTDTGRINYIERPGDIEPRRHPKEPPER